MLLAYDTLQPQPAPADRPWGLDTHQSRVLAPADLERWLCGPGSAAPTWRDLASALGPSVDVVAGAVSSALARRLRFALAVLRDVFPDDVGVRVWLYTPNAECGDERPLDVLLSGRIDQLERLAVGEWNRLVAAGVTTTL